MSRRPLHRYISLPPPFPPFCSSAVSPPRTPRRYQPENSLLTVRPLACGVVPTSIHRFRARFPSAERPPPPFPFPPRPFRFNGTLSTGTRRISERGIRPPAFVSFKPNGGKNGRRLRPAVTIISWLFLLWPRSTDFKRIIVLHDDPSPDSFLIGPPCSSRRNHPPFDSFSCEPFDFHDRLVNWSFLDGPLE